MTLWTTSDKLYVDPPVQGKKFFRCDICPTRREAIAGIAGVVSRNRLQA
jgi:hypothetical protein